MFLPTSFHIYVLEFYEQRISSDIITDIWTIYLALSLST